MKKLMTMNIIKRFFSGWRTDSKLQFQELDFDLAEELLIANFVKLNSNNKIRAIMRYGELGESDFYPLVRYSIIHDPDVSVKLAALKRIHFLRILKILLV
ncbi:hypothetical protein [Mucilaginibacter antarcticus]|uniref:hypothetical protein n=1 Tax=Mucilaginibacter antarcticus TaxID=1855725 RepID=UPI003632BA42